MPTICTLTLSRYSGTLLLKISRPKDGAKGHIQRRSIQFPSILKQQILLFYWSRLIEATRHTVTNIYGSGTTKRRFAKNSLYKMLANRSKTKQYTPYATPHSNVHTTHNACDYQYNAPNALVHPTSPQHPVKHPSSSLLHSPAHPSHPNSPPWPSTPQ